MIFRNRKVALTVGSTRMEDFDIAFAVERFLGATPDRAAFTVYNLASSTRAAVETTDLPLLFEAGYDDGVGLVFNGLVKHAESRKNGPNWETKIECESSVTAMNFAVSVSLGAGADSRLAILEILRSLGAAGAQAMATVYALPPRITARGMAETGRVKDLLARLLQPFGHTFSFQDGRVAIFAIGTKEPTSFDGKAIVLTRMTGLIGSPLKLADGKVKAVSLLNPDIRPGRQIALGSPVVSGLFRAVKCNYDGERKGQAFYVTIEGEPV